jgi:putative ABC transport system permease protein
VDTLAGTIRSGNLLFNIFAVMFTVFGAAALLLASIGLYGVLSFNVNERTRELGVRTALGASRIRLIRLVMRQAAIQLTSGMVIGVGLSLLLGRGLSFVLFGVEAADLSVLVVIAAILSLTAGVACLVPARRATRVDPVVAMQAE